MQIVLTDEALVTKSWRYKHQCICYVVNPTTEFETTVI